MSELWLPIEESPGYSVSSLGRVRSSRGVLKPWVGNKVGHLKVGLKDGRREWVHRLVARAFLGPCPDGHQVRHLNGRSDDNRSANLTYGTPVENALDKRAHGTASRPRSVCKNGHTKGPGLCPICEQKNRRAYVDKNVGVYAECDGCGKRVSVLNMTRHKRTACPRSAVA